MTELFWLGVGRAALHALPVKSWVTRRWPVCAPYDRLAFNLQPGLMPLPWKRLSVAEEKELMEGARHRQHEL